MFRKKKALGEGVEAADMDGYKSDRLPAEFARRVDRPGLAVNGRGGSLHHRATRMSPGAEGGVANSGDRTLSLLALIETREAAECERITAAGC